MTGRWIGSGGYVIWPFRVLLCLKIGDLSGIKSMYVDSSACVRVKGGESE